MSHKFHILIVDDEKFNIELAAVYLKEEGYKLSFATNATSALQSVMAKKIDLILLDINMPVTDGFEVCRLLKEDKKSKDIPVIFLTAQTDIEYISRAFELGGVDYISKPFNGVELKVRVKTHLQTLKNLQEIKEKQSKLAQLSITDPLSKLYNGLYFETQFKEYQKKYKQFNFLYIKIDQFEKINTLYGFAGANKLLRLFSKLLQESMPKGSVVARLHGVSFAILLKDYERKSLDKFINDFYKMTKEDKNLAKALWYGTLIYKQNADSDSLANIYKRAQKDSTTLVQKHQRVLYL